MWNWITCTTLSKYNIYETYSLTLERVFKKFSILIKSWMSYSVYELLFQTELFECFYLFNFLEKSPRDLLSSYTH